MPVITNADELEDRALEAADPHQAARLMDRARVARQIEDAENVLEAIETLERASAQMSVWSLPDLVERLARIRSRALARLRAAEHQAVVRTRGGVR